MDFSGAIPVIDGTRFWSDYQLLDVAGGLKREQFGELILLRPEPQAVWGSGDEILSKPFDALFKGDSPTTGRWESRSKSTGRWTIGYESASLSISFRLAMTAFKHVGLFPEQSANWEFAAESIQKLPESRRNVLNLFAYTGGASFAAAKAGAAVTHVDAVKQVVNWAAENAQLNGISSIRWMVDDAVKFVQREIRRGNKYQGIILDPPAFGHGPNGEKWKLEEQIDSLVSMVAQLLDPEHHFLVLNTYSLGFSALVTENLLRRHMPGSKRSVAEIVIPSRSGDVLPLGVVGRLTKGI